MNVAEMAKIDERFGMEAWTEIWLVNFKKGVNRAPILGEDW